MDDITNVHQSITKALQEVRENKLSIRKAAAKYGVPRSTFHDRVTGKIAEGRVTKGPDPYLSTKEEKIIAEWCSNISKCGFPLKTDDLLNTVQKIIKDTKRITPFKDGRPGKTWLTSFFKRNPSLAARQAETITKGRAVITSTPTNEYFFPICSIGSPAEVVHPEAEPSCVPSTSNRSCAASLDIGTPLSSLSRRSSTSSVLSKHLFYPKPTTYGSKMPIKKEGSVRSLSAISSMAWRNIIAEKEKIKQEKIDAIKRKKVERQVNKENRLRKKPIKKKKEKCNCFEELHSDIEEEELKNIGCDSCARWFHLKCTPMFALTYSEASQKDFVCSHCG